MEKKKTPLENVRDGLTLSGLDISKIDGIKDSWIPGFDEWFSGDAWMHFNLKDAKKEDFIRVESLVNDMSKYDNLGDFLRVDAHETQQNEVAAFVFVLIDRLAIHARDGRDGWLAMEYVFQLYEAMDYFSPERKSVRNSVRKAANARHAENRAMKQEAFEWYSDHGHTLKNDDAAIEIKKLVPVSLRTAQDWITGFRKVLRSARTT